MFCGKCGQLNNDFDQFCISCGRELNDPSSFIEEKDSSQDTSRLKQKFPGLSSRFYEHPDDKKTLKLCRVYPLWGI